VLSKKPSPACLVDRHSDAMTRSAVRSSVCSAEVARVLGAAD